MEGCGRTVTLQFPSAKHSFRIQVQIILFYFFLLSCFYVFFYWRSEFLHAHDWIWLGGLDGMFRYISLKLQVNT